MRSRYKCWETSNNCLIFQRHSPAQMHINYFEIFQRWSRHRIVLNNVFSYTGIVIVMTSADSRMWIVAPTMCLQFIVWHIQFVARLNAHFTQTKFPFNSMCSYVKFCSWCLQTLHIRTINTPKIWHFSVPFD